MQAIYSRIVENDARSGPESYERRLNEDFARKLIQSQQRFPEGEAKCQHSSISSLPLEGGSGGELISSTLQHVAESY